MPQVNVKFDDVPEFKDFEPGTYALECVEAELGTSKAGNSKLVLQFEVLSPEEYSGRKAWSHLVLEGDGRWKTKEALQAMLGEAPETFDTEELVGVEVDVYGVPNEYPKDSGQVNLSIRKWMSGSSAAGDIDDLFE